jgi:hypothetical protein
MIPSVYGALSITYFATLASRGKSEGQNERIPRRRLLLDKTLTWQNADERLLRHPPNQKVPAHQDKPVMPR